MVVLVWCIQERSSVLAAECASALLTFYSAHSCNPPVAFISVGELYPPLRLIFFVSLITEVRFSSTEIKQAGGQNFLSLEENDMLLLLHIQLLHRVCMP